MARSPITASKEGEATLAAEETLHFDDDNLRGEEQHAVSLSCRQRITFARLTPLVIYFLGCGGSYNIEFKPFYSIFVKDMLTMSFNFISAVAEVKDGMTKTRKIDHFHFSFFHFFLNSYLARLTTPGFQLQRRSHEERGRKPERRKNKSPLSAPVSPPFYH